MDSRRCIELVWETWARRHHLDPSTIIGVAHGRRTSETLRGVPLDLDVPTEVAVLDALEEAEHRGVETVPGARELLAGIPESRWAVVTSGSPAVARLRLHLGQIPAPSVLITAADVRQGKPAPEGYLRAAAALNHPPSACVVLEDTPVGVQAGRAAGMVVLAVRGTYPDDQLAGAHAVITSLAALQCTSVGADGLELKWGATASS